MHVCDGCGAPADEAHIRERIERLEMATRFRPIHIQTLLLAEAPPSRIEDYFYRPLRDGESRSSAAKDFFVEVMKAAGISPDAAANEEAALAEFQHRGFLFGGRGGMPGTNTARIKRTHHSRVVDSAEANRILLPPEARRADRRWSERNNSGVAGLSNRRSPARLFLSCWAVRCC